MIKAIIFDWAGVIGADGYWVWLNKNIKNINDHKSFFQKISEDVDCAKISHHEFMELLSQESGKPQDQIWKEVKKEIILNKELISIIKKIKNKYKIGLLSNFTYPWLNEILTENNLWELFDKNIISSEHKMIKPNPEIFQNMISTLDVKPEEAVFVDDRQIHIEGAKKVGLEGILFTDNNKFINDLLKLGINA
jgi:putative hydrolase of the HAD superfamily